MFIHYGQADVLKTHFLLDVFFYVGIHSLKKNMLPKPKRYK